MKIIVTLVLSGALLSNSVWAAKFQTITNHKNEQVNTLARIAKRLQRNKAVFGDCSSTVRLSFTRKDSEQDLNTIKQLNIAKAGVFDQDDPNPTLSHRPASAVASELLENANRDEHAAIVEAAGTEIAAALSAIPRANISVFEASHANEDGSWKILDVLDKKNNEVLLVKFGYCGT